MKKLILLIALIAAVPFVSSMASSQNCRSNFLDNYVGDSKSFKIADESLMNDFESNPRNYSIESVKHLSDELGGKSGLLCEFEIKLASCKEVVPKKPSSMVCYLESNFGYFIVSKDMLSGVNIIYNRWD